MTPKYRIKINKSKRGKPEFNPDAYEFYADEDDRGVAEQKAYELVMDSSETARISAKVFRVDDSGEREIRAFSLR